MNTVEDSPHPPARPPSLPPAPETFHTRLSGRQCRAGRPGPSGGLGFLPAKWGAEPSLGWWWGLGGKGVRGEQPTMCLSLEGQLRLDTLTLSARRAPSVLGVLRGRAAEWLGLWFQVKRPGRGGGQRGVVLALPPAA